MLTTLAAGAVGGLVAVVLLDLVVMLVRLSCVRRRRNPLLRTLPR